MLSIRDYLVSVDWFVPLLVYIPIAYIGIRWLGKHLADMPNQTNRLTVNFTFGALGSGVFALLMGDLRFNTATFVLIGFGLLNGAANIYEWRATRISLSKTSLLSFGDDIIAILLAILIIGDGKYVNWLNGTGMILCLMTGILFWWHSFEKKAEAIAFYYNVVIYSILWGVISVAMRYFALDEVPVAQFVFAFYFGSLLSVGGLKLYEVLSGKGEKVASSLKPKDYILQFVFMLGIAVCLAIEYWALMLAPLTTIQPILLVAEAIVPTIVGLWVFKEGSSFDRAQWSFAVLGLIGTCMVAFGLSQS